MWLHYSHSLLLEKEGGTLFYSLSLSAFHPCAKQLSSLIMQYNCIKYSTWLSLSYIHFICRRTSSSYEHIFRQDRIFGFMRTLIGSILHASKLYYNTYKYSCVQTIPELLGPCRRVSIYIIVIQLSFIIVE
jgi:hypothetical protein